MVRQFWVLLISSIIALSSCTVQEKLTNSVNLETVRENDVLKEYKHITIASIGHSVTRVFFDNLYKELDVLLARKGITTKKVFLGNDTTTVKINLLNITNADGQNPVLIIYPQTSGTVTENNEEIIAFYSRSLKLKQDVVISMFEKGNYELPVWKSIMEMNINFTQKTIYQEIARKTLLEMIDNKIIQ